MITKEMTTERGNKITFTAEVDLNTIILKMYSNGQLVAESKQQPSEINEITTTNYKELVANGICARLDTAYLNKNKGILGGQGGVELKLEWMYSNHALKPESLHTHSVLIYANEDELTDTSPFAMGEKREAKISIGKSGGTAGGKAANYKISLPTKWMAEMGIEEDARDVEMTFVDGKIIISKN